ncbi:MAG TPA: crosslink repair DNA glycosylase YcaQ family protein [Nocardioidaceae bacterium]
MAVRRDPVSVSLSTADARRIALLAQGFGEPRPPGRVDVRHLRRTLDRLGVLQIDSVNVLCRSHYLPLFARLGPYPRERLDAMAWGGGRRELFEYWGHRASLLPVSLHPLMRWRMDAARVQHWDFELLGWRTAVDPAVAAPWAVIAGMTRLSRESPGLVDEVLAVVAERGPIAAGEVDRERRSRDAPDPDPTTGAMWNWQDAKIALELLFSAGQVTTATRRGFERAYDLTERVLPTEVLAVPTPDRADAQRELVRIAARAQGVATERHLRDYFDLPAAEAKVRIAELVDTGELLAAQVEGVSQRSFLWATAEARRPVTGQALLSPFDSLIWDRDRTERLFGFHYRISIYTPEAQRTHGYYVLPFLLGERLVARVDLKSDRRASTLLVQGAYAEPGVSTPEVAAALGDELRAMADWLELDRVHIVKRGDLATTLAGRLPSQP